MSLDPIDYDVVELRELARRRGDRYVEDGFLWPEPSEGFPPIDDLAEFDRPERWTGSHEERQKPYLAAVPESRAAASLVDRWIERLVERAGFDGAVEALSYYRAMGWITETVEADLQDYLLAAGHHPGGSLDDLDRDAHVDSLARIIALAQLAGRQSPDGVDGVDGAVAADDGETGSADESDARTADERGAGAADESGPGAADESGPGAADEGGTTGE